MKKIVRLLILFVWTMGWGGFPAKYYPVGGHPRLWLTQERIDAMQLERQQNGERWREFKELCDSLTDADPDNDPWDLKLSPQNYTAPLALMYRLTGEKRFAERALELLDLVSTDLSRYGDPDHQSFYFLGLSYDWLYDYPGLDEAHRDRVRKKMRILSRKFWKGWDLTASGTDSDANLLTGNLHLVLGAALYGDDPAAVTMLDRAWFGWKHGYYVDHGTSNRGMILAGLGGVYFTGMAYFPSTDIVGILGYELTLKTACGYDVNTKEPRLKPFWGNFIRSLIALTEPGRKRVDDYGSWQDPNILAEQPWLRRALIVATWFAEQAGDRNAAALGTGYARQVDIGYDSDPFLEFFFVRPDAKSRSPYRAHLPRIRFARSPDFLLFRDGWGLKARWGVFRGDGSVPLDQQAMDQGHFSLWRGDSYLTKGARNYEALSHGDFFNTLSIENGCTLNGVPCSGTAIFDSQKAARITRHREEQGRPLLAYAMLNADGQWNDPPQEENPVINVKSYRRHFVWMGDYTVIFDRLRARKPIWVHYRLRALTEPEIDGDTVTQRSVNGKYKLMQKTLEPVGTVSVKVDEKKLWKKIPDWVVNRSERHWQSVIKFTDIDRLNLLNVLQSGPDSMENFDRLERLGSHGNIGVRIGKFVVSFATEEQLRSKLRYQLSDSVKGMWHLVADLKAGRYEYFFNGKKAGELRVKQGDNTALFRSDLRRQRLKVQLKWIGK